MQAKEAAAQQPDVARTQLQVQALRTPLPPLEDAPLPPPPPPGRAGSGREERCEGAEHSSAPAPAPAPRRPGLGSPRCAGAAS